MRTALSSFIVVSLLFVSCKKSQGTSSVNIGQLADAYAELLVLNERYGMAKDSLSSQRYATEYRQILRNHSLTKEEYASQFETVVTSASLYRELCDRALAKLQTMRGRPDTTRTQGSSLRAY
jgi:hypothetical protein